MKTAYIVLYCVAVHCLSAMAVSIMQKSVEFEDIVKGTSRESLIVARFQASNGQTLELVDELEAKSIEIPIYIKPETGSTLVEFIVYDIYYSTSGIAQYITVKLDGVTQGSAYNTEPGTYDGHGREVIRRTGSFGSFTDLSAGTHTVKITVDTNADGIELDKVVFLARKQNMEWNIVHGPELND